MPELPEVETVRRTLAPHLVGNRLERLVVREARLRAPIDVAAVSRLSVGREVLGVRRRGKYLLLDLAGDVVLLLHLGMTGRLVIRGPGEPLAKHDHVIWTLGDGRELRFNDARRFGLIEAVPAGLVATHPRLAKLGLEPLDEDFDAEALHRLTRASGKPIKNLLMDASCIVGIGNIYASEALFSAAIAPSLPACQLSRARAGKLVQAVRRVLRAAIRDGGTTLRDFNDANGASGHFAGALRVYGREGQPCHRCGRLIRRRQQAGRSTFYCPACQRR
jgi:formamidopyrimidine-DNA glycosylase